MPRERRRKPDRLEQYQSETYKRLQRRLANNVRVLRDGFGWTQEEAAHRCGIATRLLQRVEGEDVNPTLTTLARLVEGLKTDAATLFGKPTK